MKKYFLILSLFFSIKLFSQFEYVNQSDLYIKDNVKEIYSFFHHDSLIVNDELWRVDSKGRIVYYELLPVDDDSSFSATIWNYKNDRLVALKNIGIWNTKTNKLDTSLIEYFYDSSNNLEKELYTNTKDNDTLTQVYNYNSGLRISGKLYNKNQSWWFKKDTLNYYESKILKLKSRTNYSNGFIDLSTKQYFDALGMIQTEIVSDFNSEPTRIKTFIYDNNKLVRIKEVDLGINYSKSVSSSETIYEYNENGFLIKCVSFRNNKYLNHETFEYK